MYQYSMQDDIHLHKWSFTFYLLYTPASVDTLVTLGPWAAWLELHTAGKGLFH